jgi:dTDP-4-amino-4,6-dideoxygalactose transaminase
VIDRLKREGVGCGVHYPTPIHLQPPHRRLGPPGSFPVSERLAGRVLSLPLYAELEDEEVERVVAVVSGVLESGA